MKIHISRRRAAATSAVLIATVPLSCMGMSRPSPRQPLPEGPLELADETWVHNTLSGMSLEQRIGQLLMVRLSGGYGNLRGPDMRHAEQLITQAHIGSFEVGPGSPLEIAAKLNELQRRSVQPLLFAAALEWGGRAWLRQPFATPYEAAGGGGTVFPFNMGIAATGDPGIAELAGRISGTEARATGVHWLFAPIVDVNTAADNPLINVRSYSDDAYRVSTFASEFIRGATAAGVLTTARHFPGHGDTRVDSHVGLPVLHEDVTVLHDRELRPFRAAIAAGVSSVMVGQIAVPSLTGGVALPATQAPQLMRTLLRDELGFRGIVVTDAMTMGALTDAPGYARGELIVRAIEAGADMVLAPPDPVLAHRALVDAVRSGRLPYTRVDSSVTRILRAKARLGLHRDRTVPLDSVARVVGAPEHAIIADAVAARALTLVRDSGAVLPLDPRHTASVVLVAFTEPDDLVSGVEMANELSRIYGRGVSFLRLHENTATIMQDSAVALAAAADAVILALHTMPSPGRGHLTVPPAARRLAAALRMQTHRMVVISFGDPYGPATLAGATTYMLGWQPPGGVAERPAARAIAGHAPIPGTLPFTMPRAVDAIGLTLPPEGYSLEFATPEDVGMDGDLLALVDTIIASAIIRGAAPGAALAVGRRGRIVRLKGYGTLDRRRGLLAPVTDSTIYDIASLTKVVATTTAVMMLVDDGVIRLDDPVGKYLPEWSVPSKERVTVLNLLLHDSGLPAYAPLWRELRGREHYRRRIAAMSLEFEPGSRTQYSDFGPVVLGMIVEQVSGRQLDLFLRERLFAPLGMRDTGFNPLQWPFGSIELNGDDGGGAAPEPVISRIAPTENDQTFRMRHIHGQVHDENAFALGGVAGHAGLFSSARDMAVFAQLMLNRGFYGNRRIVDPSTLELFTRRHDPGDSRALGWDTPSPGSSAGRFFSARSFGHTGFTGPSLWIDPERDVFVVLLMNRVNPTRDNDRHIQLRRDVADAVQRSIIDPPVPPRIDER